jgi:hypothetical protein
MQRKQGLQFSSDAVLEYRSPIIYKGLNSLWDDQSDRYESGDNKMSEGRACADFDRSTLSRRQMLQVGALGTLGLSLPTALRAEARSGLKVRAKSVILLHQFGGVPQQDTFDMKPNAPAELQLGGLLLSCRPPASGRPRFCRGLSLGFPRLWLRRQQASAQPAARAHFRLTALDDRRRRVSNTWSVRGLSRQGT